MGNIAARTLSLLSLLQSRQEWTATELAERLEVTPRTVRRDVERLRQLGYPVRARRGSAGHYRLAPGSDVPPLLLGDEEVIAIALALQTAPTSVSGLGESTAAALRSIRSLLPTRLSQRLDSLSVEHFANPWDLAPPAVPTSVLSTLTTSAAAQEVLKFHYVSADRDDEEEVVAAEPHRVVVWAGRWHLVAYDQGSGTWRAFRVDRLRDVRRPGWRFRPRAAPDPDLARFVQGQPDRGDSSGAWPCRGTVVMALPAELAARWAPGGASVEPVGDRSCRMTMGAWSWAGLVGLLMTFDADFVVEGPDELRGACARLIPRLTSAGQPPPGGSDPAAPPQQVPTTAD